MSSILTCPVLSYMLGWFLFQIVVFRPLCLNPIPNTYIPNPLLHFPHRSYPFFAMEEGKWFFHFVFFNVITYMYRFTNSIFLKKTYNMFISNYYKMHWTWRINDTTSVKILNHSFGTSQNKTFGSVDLLNIETKSFSVSI